MKRRLFFFVFLLVLMSTFLFAQELKKVGRYYVAEIEKKFDVKKGGDLVMENIRGDVQITTWGKNIVQIHETRKMDVYTEQEARAVLKDLKSVYRQSDNTVNVGAEGSFRSYMSSKFKIVLPNVFNADVSTKGGDVSIADLNGSAELKTSGGDLDIQRIDGRVNAKTSGGDIKVKMTTKEVYVKTSGGDIDVIDVGGKVTAKTSGGDIKVKNNKAKVVASTSGGSIELYNVGAEVEAHTSGGDIIVDGSKGSLGVSTSGGDIELKNINDVIKAKTSGQRKYVEAAVKNDICFAIGPAGTGKTYLAVALAVSSLKKGIVKKIILARPAVEAGESLGFLPGDFRDKIDPYLKPLYDALDDMLPSEKLRSYLEKGVVEIVPLAYMRGRTLNNAFVILDEAQNATAMQMKMFLTRLGVNSKAIVTGDITQIDLQPKQVSGLVQARDILSNIKGVSFVYFDRSDVVRHRLVKDIIDAYDKFNGNNNS